jgi:GR25 family glycosyltransferase involved in LPS biosynthesis
MDKLKELFPYIAYINLDSRPDRNESAQQEFQYGGLNPERVPGVSIQGTNNAMVNGMMGCTLSHLKILLEAKRRKQNVLIFEDDAKFINDYNTVIDGACEQLKEKDWFLFYLGANILKPFQQISKNLARLNHAQSTVAYGVNLKNIDTIISAILTNQVAIHEGSTVLRPIDMIYADIIVPRVPCFITAPEMVVIQKNSYSDIENREVDYESYLEKRYRDNFQERLDNE